MRERLGLATAASGLRVTDIVIEGRANTPETLLRAAIGVNKGDPILGFSLEETRARIETIPWVEHATVERRSSLARWWSTCRSVARSQSGRIRGSLC